MAKDTPLKIWHTLPRDSCDSTLKEYTKTARGQCHVIHKFGVLNANSSKMAKVL